MRVYFFEVELDAADRTFPELFEEAANRTGLQRVAKINKDTEVRLERPSKATKEIAGDLVRIRMTSIPSKIHRSGGTAEIELESEQGIGEETAFLYDRDLRVLAIEANRSGVSPSAVARYFTNTNDENTEVRLLPVLDLSKLQELQSLRSISSVDVAVTADSELLSLAPPATVGSMVQTAKSAGAPQLEMRFSVGNAWRDTSLNTGGIVELVRFFLRKAPDNVTQLKINGENEDNERKHLDMLHGRLHYESKRNASLRRPTFEQRRSILKEALQHHQALGKLKAPGSKKKAK